MNDVILLKDENSLFHFCRSKKKIYLYGAGQYGETYYRFLKSHNIYVGGYIVTEKTEETHSDLPVFEAEKFIHKLDKDCGIILSLSEKYHNSLLKKFSFPCQVAYCDKNTISLFAYSKLFGLLDNCQNKFCIPSADLAQNGQKILVTQVEYTYGDIIWSTAFLRELRRNFPNSRITMIINTKMMNFLRYCPYVDEFIGYEINRRIGEPFSEADSERVIGFCREKKLSYDVVYVPRLLYLDICDLWENLFLAIGSGAKIRIAHIMTHSRYLNAAADRFEKYFTKLVRHTTGEHEVLRNLKLLGNRRIEKYEMELWLGNEEINFAKSVFEPFLDRAELFIAVGLVGSTPERLWSPIKYNQTIRKVIKDNHKVMFIFLGGDDAADAAREAKSEVENSCVDLTGKTTLLQAAAVVSMCDCYLGADTGLMHMASSFKKPIIMLSCILPDSSDTNGSHPKRTGPWCVKNIILRPPYALDGCKYLCSKKYSHCINLIEVGDVLKAIKTLVDFIKEENDK